MGNGLKRLAALCGGIKVKDNKSVAEYDKDGVLTKVVRKKTTHSHINEKSSRQDDSNK